MKTSSVETPVTVADKNSRAVMAHYWCSNQRSERVVQATGNTPEEEKRRGQNKTER
jgi:hypothetical protein